MFAEQTGLSNYLRQSQTYFYFIYLRLNPAGGKTKQALPSNIVLDDKVPDIYQSR